MMSEKHTVIPGRFPAATPESVGIASPALLRMMKRLAVVEYLNSIIVLRHGRSVLECWLEPYERTTPHQLFSLSKSFTSCAIGLAQAEGRLKITDKLVSFFPEYDGCITDPRMRQATLQDLLTMRSGHLVACATKYMAGQQDWVEAYLASPLDVEPGTQFTYNSGATYMLSAVIRKVTGGNVREYLIPRLFEPLGIVPGIWECCPRGINFGGWGLSLTTDDLAKFAQLLLRHGQWNGRQLLPADYLAEATRVHSDNSMNTLPDWRSGYGYQFWVSRHGYRGDGAAGQFAVVLKEHDLCIVTTSCVTNMQAMLDAFWEELLPALSPVPLPEDPAAQRELQEYLAGMKIRPPEGAAVSRHDDALFRFRENSAGIRQCEVAFSGEGCALTFLTDRGIEQLRAGFGHFEYSVFQLTDIRPHPVAAYAVWRSPETLEIHSFIRDGIYRDIWTVDFADQKEPLKNRRICATFRPALPPLLRSGR